MSFPFLRRYRELYISLMQDLPTLELVDGGINTIGGKTLINKHVNENRIDELILFDSSSREDGKILTAPSATVTLDDPLNFVYLLELDRPRLLYTRSGGEWRLPKPSEPGFFWISPNRSVHWAPFYRVN